MLDLTVALPVRNEERNLAPCLQAIGTGFARSVVVIDSSSTDATAEMARSHGAEVVNFEWNGRFPKKRNWFLRHHTPPTAWVLFLDADEILSPDVKCEIAAVLPQSPFKGYRLTYTNYFLGRRLRGGYPLHKLALFRVGEVEYERIEEEAWSQCDMEVHEHPIVRGSIGTIRSRIDHRDLRGIDAYMRKHNEYAAWEAQRLLASLRESAAAKTWSRNQRLKYRLVTTPWGGLVFFFGSFFLMGGWRDGSVGFAFSLLKSAYFVQIACRYRELEQLPPIPG
ncbi:glycosyltransferase family 2 protein [Synechococcus sp. CS-1332]|uniref:glycosyltransferase family 2 protein n=1 Tax=Synechococcus sp. CS-1332 TaxID=2847972 RepID=UPI00223BD3FF|nr:glycosyltransferase family 2 protein [Synechococcus sp. CS-1332]MCT0208296.1 glycosyltransferase family 2 protein [Synechococcus sp. CS-1332]